MTDDPAWLMIVAILQLAEMRRAVHNVRVDVEKLRVRVSRIESAPAIRDHIKEVQRAS